MKNQFHLWFSSFLHLFFPQRCVVCDVVLQEGEEVVCLECNMDMPRTHYHLRADNPVERLFWGKVPLERGTSFFFYQKGSGYRPLLHLLKYGGRTDIGETMGRFMAAELSASAFFRDIDVVVPVPLHPRKLQMRGYNQSECLARGITAVTRIPFDTTSVIRERYTESQTSKSAYERWENVEGIFRLLRPEHFVGKHVLLVDDVLTTGSTITACADVFQRVEGVRISVLTLAVAVY